jgi:hypothetical protein
MFSLSVLGAVLGFALVSLPANADMVKTDQVAQTSLADQARENVKTLAQRPELAKQLQALGVTPDQVQARVAAMTDDEVIAMSGKLDSLVAAGSITNNDLLLILLVVLLIVAL